MIDKNYLLRFGESRYNNFAMGVKVKCEKFWSDPLDKISMKFLKNLDQCDDWSSFMYDLYYYSERIQRIDFFSKYYLHSLIPKARNLDSIKVLLIFNNNIYVFNTLKDNIEIYKQKYFINLNPEKMYIAILNDNRKLQEYYGDFHLMLSMLNTGHALFNIEHVLKCHNQKYKHVDVNSIDFSKTLEYITVPKLLEVEIHDKMLNFEKEIKLINNKNLFLKRTSNQNISGDSIIKKQISKLRFDNFAKEILKVERKDNINLAIYIDNVDSVKSGYYIALNNSLKHITSKSLNDVNNLIYEYQEFTNIAAVNMWIFFYADKDNFEEDSSKLFMDLGYMAQEISIIASKYSLAARGMKNYNDSHIKKNFRLEENKFIGYSLAIFPKLNYGHSMLME